jgi:CheY-like chemotaxis protein
MGAAKIVRQLMIYSGTEGSDRQPVDIAALINEMRPLLKVVMSKQVILEVEVGADLPEVSANAAQIEQVLMSLVTNASEAIGEQEGVIRVVTGNVKVSPAYQVPNGNGLSEGDYLQIEVTDTGSGMTHEVQARVFDPFFTTKFTGRGLGLAVVQGIVRSHGGAIHVQSTLGQGSVFRVLLPATTCEVPTSHGSDTAHASEQGPRLTVSSEQIVARTETILVVEDEDMLRSAVARFLRKNGFAVLEALDGFDAMEVLRSHAGELDAVLLDVTLPGVPSRDVFENVQRLRPQAKIILTSAYARDAVQKLFAGLTLAHFVRKPFQLTDLLILLRDAIRRDRSVSS